MEGKRIKVVKNMPRLFILVLSVFCYSFPVSAMVAGQDPVTSTIVYFDVQATNRAWQGVATDGKFIYTTTDQDVKFHVQPETVWDSNDIISVFDMNGNFIKEKKNAYTGKDSYGDFMSFGDIQYIDGYLYATVYNRRPPFESKVVKFDKASLNVVSEYNIGTQLAEGVDKHDGSFWVVYHSQKVINQYDESFTLVKSWNLDADIPENGGYQGVFWEGDYLYANLHGANSNGEYYSPGLDKYYYDGTSLKFVERIKPPTYGSGQGIEARNGKYYWIDRPENRVVITDSIKTGRLKEIRQPTTEALVFPKLLNGWVKYDDDRTVTLWKDDSGVVHLEGTIKGGYTTDGRELKPAFVLPEGYRPRERKNFPIITNSGIGRLAMWPDGQVFVVTGGIDWTSFDGITYLAFK